MQLASQRRCASRGSSMPATHASSRLQLCRMVRCEWQNTRRSSTNCILSDMRCERAGLCAFPHGERLPPGRSSASVYRTHVLTPDFLPVLHWGSEQLDEEPQVSGRGCNGNTVQGLELAVTGMLVPPNRTVEAHQRAYRSALRQFYNMATSKGARPGGSGTPLSPDSSAPS